MLFLAADIGGTRARLLLGQWHSDGSWQTVRQKELASRDYPSLSVLLHDFLTEHEKPPVACLALAGPVAHNRCQLTNLSWLVDGPTLQQEMGFEQVLLLNDFVAQAHGLRVLKPEQRITLQEGEPDPNAPCALIGAGTGLGMAVVHQQQVLSSEGGHADFPALDDQQWALRKWLHALYGRVSLETIISGKGIERLHVFLGGAPAEAALISELATVQKDPQAIATLSLFARMYAAAASNLALNSLALGGVYLGGGIAPRILPFLRQPETLAAFHHRTPMQSLLERIPLYVVLDDYLGLRGAAEVAARLAHQHGGVA